MSWTKYEEKATAIHPFTPAQDEHLKVLTGDRLEITEKNGRWVKCKNLETSCVGICPIQCLQIASQNPQDNFSLLGVEVQYLFDYIFKTYFPTKSPNENDMHILDLVKKVQSCYPPTESTRVQLALSIDDLRSALGLTQFQRDQFGNVITTHTTTKSLFSSDSSKDINKTKSAYTSQLEVTLSFTYTFNTELRLCFRLYDKQKNEVLSAPADIFLPANCEEKQTLKFINIEKNNFSSTAIVCRAFGITKPGEGIPDLYEYKGIAASMLQPPKDFHTSADQHLQLQFHSMNEISQIDSVDAILNSTFGENDISPLSVQVNFLEYIDKAKNVTESNVIPTLSIPQNISTSLDANYTYVRIHLLHHKTKLKKTRVVLRVLDIEKKEYINCFEHTSDPSVFPSVVQKGSTDMKIDEIAAIKLDKNSDLSKWIMIFEVQRPNKGQVHLSSYAIESLLNNDNTLNESKDKKLTLNKPTAQVMTPEDYINQFINTKTKSTGTGGDLNISITSVSTDFTKNPTIYKILHWKDHVQELEEDNVETPKDIEQVTLSIFMNRIFINLAEMMISKNPKLEQFSTNFFVKTLYEIDQSKSQLFKSFFDGFIETQFNPNNTVLSNLHTLFMKYIADALPSSSDNKNNNNGDEYSLGDCKICCRCLFHILSIISASLKMNTEIKNENQFKESVKIIFQRLGILMSIEDKTMIVFKSFVARSFPMLCDIALGYFQQNERIKLVIDFFNANAFKSDTNDDIVKQTRANNENEKLLDLITLFDQTKPKVKKQGSDLFFNNLNLFAQYIYDLGRYPNQRQYEDERTTAIISVLNSCRNNNDFQLFPHFASKLYELHINLGNKVEAAEALIECSKILKWDDREHVSEGHGFPEQEKRERKRLILHKAVELYIESEFYEKALEVLEELLKYYQDYEENQIKISEVYELESKCYDLICNQERNILNRFYGVKFYGSKFDTYFKDKTFVYRRNGFFMNDQMMRDLKDKFPEAKVDPKPPSDEDLKDPNLYYIYVFNLKPKDLDNFDCYMPQSTLMVKSCCNIQEFYSETPIRIKREGNYGEFAEWHRNVITYNTEMPLQGIARRSTVIKTSPVKVMSPIECAIYDTNQKTLELMQKACMYWRCIRFKLKFNAVAVSSFSMLQNGIVNAAVNGGTKIFQELFLESDLRLEKINQLNAQKLKDAFADQLKAVNFALQVHYIVKSAQYNELHQNIVENFEEMKKQMEKAIGTINLTERATMFEIPPTDFFEAPLDKGE
ncbi:SH3 domain containing protein [Histomonas meleagridis]|uniref:SH3 domain containing protein n=1 Tax=Histomonas meleagridis TaxID=135588 RepID=UPI003559FB30|nr:SH3 domain containing protein [Histomonas meleagridis]KAH0804234.1 SH3 domain containing protein [Histomonas meleagridis]